MVTITTRSIPAGRSMHMNLFSELYNCYYQVTAQTLRQASINPLTRQQICEIAETEG